MIFLSLLISTAFIIAVSNVNLLSASNCGIRPLFSGQKIVNGDEAIPGDWAWNVAIMDWGHFICGGVLINEQWILTAAHCFEHNDDPSSLSIDIGVHNRVSKEPWVKSVKVEKVILHENFNLISYINDVALVKLTKPIVLDDKYYVAACIPDNDSDFDSQNKTAWLTGWGSTYFGGSPTLKKLQLSMTVLTDSRCKQYYSQVYNVLTQICAGEFNGNTGACYGDSGGPFVRQMDDGRWYVIGLISWGYDCGKGTVFTRVTYFLPWIKDKLTNNSN